MKKKLWLLFIVSLFILCNYVVKTYALFESNMEGELQNEIGHWNIKLNDILMSTSKEQTITINSFTYDESENTKSGYISPGSSGYFDLILDTTDTDVAVEYNISIDLDNIENENISLDVSVIGGSKIENSSVGVYSGILTLQDIASNPQIVLRVTINWNNVVEYDDTDTELGMQVDSKLTVPIKINVEQYLGE